MKDKVSIVIPVYNSEKFLRQSIESAINQTYENIETIAIDDGSTDDSPRILKEYQDKITIHYKKNNGLASALNDSIKEISGKWFKWLSPDDILKQNAIELLVDEAKKLAEETIIYSNWELIDENNQTLRTFSESNYNALDVFDFNVRLLDGQQINVNTTLIPTSLFRKGCVFSPVDPVAIDYDFFLRAGIIYNVKFQLIEKTLLEYRIHTDQMSHKNISETLDFLSDIRKNILSEIEPVEREKYNLSLEKYQKEKPLSKKTMDLGLKIVSSLPSWVSDKMLVFYLNQIRRSR